MPTPYTIPRPSEPVLDQNGHFTVPWQNYLRTRYGDAAASEIIAELEAQIADLLARVEALEEGESARIVGPQSVSVVGSLANGLVQLTLVGDSVSPDPEYYYGTDASGAKGFHPLPEPPPALVPYFIPADTTYIVPLYSQGLFTMPIDVEGTLGVDGYLIEVD